ncbi:MAG: hypothetical protein AB1649_12075 [Chloroflexota bacterium]
MVIIPAMMERFTLGLQTLIAFILCSLLFSYSTPPITDKVENVRAHTRAIEFDYISWTLDAAFIKLQAAAVNTPYSLGREEQKEIVMEFLRVTQTSLEQEHQLEQLFADPAITDKEGATAQLRADLAATQDRLSKLAPLAEAIIQNQVSEVLADVGLTSAGQPVPNVLYHATPLPMALIVSPRDRIEQTVNISIETNFTVDEQVELETSVDKGLNVSSLVVPIGGVGVYPTMVARTTDLRWLLEVVSHEWIHNYLTFRPLGFNYNTTPELRTMNETTANIAGKEIGMLVLERYYPELMSPASNPTLSLAALPREHPDPSTLPRPPFDFRAEMHETRITTDALLAEGKIEEAEAYMEARRQIFLENGYLLRKINQAYFAFYGAYADVPGGAAGEDPVGPAVRALRDQSTSLEEFVNRIAWMTSFEELQQAIQ